MAQADVTVGSVNRTPNFIISVDREKGESLMDWATAVRLPWGALRLWRSVDPPLTCTVFVPVLRALR